MPTRRMIDPAIWQSESLATLTINQRYLFIGLFSNADDQGRLKGHPALVRSAIFPFDDISLDQIQDNLKAIEEVGSITIYQKDGKTIIQILGWWDYQSPQYATPSDLPAPDNWIDRINYNAKGNIRIRQNWKGMPDLPEDNSKDGAPRPPGSPEPDQDGKYLDGNAPDKVPTQVPTKTPYPIDIVVDKEKDLKTTTTTTTRAHEEDRISKNLALITEKYQILIAVTFSQNLADEFREYAIRCRDPSWIEYAFDEMEAANVRNWRYPKKILETCIANGGIKSKPSQNGANREAYQRNNRNHQKTGHELNQKPTFDPYTGEVCPPDT
jgi:hypothetical protein